MVSGLVTSPELQERICLEEARPISMASKLLMSIMRFLGSGRWEGAGAGRVGRSGLRVEVLGGPEQVVVLLAQLGLLALLGDDVDVERQRLHLLEQDLEGLGNARLGDVLALDDRLVSLYAPDRVVGLDGQHLLERVRGP